MPCHAVAVINLAVAGDSYLRICVARQVVNEHCDGARRGGIELDHAVVSAGGDTVADVHKIDIAAAVRVHVANLEAGEARANAAGGPDAWSRRSSGTWSTDIDQ